MFSIKQTITSLSPGVNMGLKYELTEAPSEELKALYKEKDGKYVLDVEGVVPQAKLDEFRTNNVSLKEQLEKLTKTPLNNVDPKTINVDEILEKHVKDMKSNYDGQVKTISEENAALKGHLERVVLSDSVKTAASEYGVLPSALPDVLNRAKEMFIVKDGVAIPKDKTADKEGKPYTVTSWITSLNDSAPHLFAPSRGSGSQPPVRGKPPIGELTGIDRIAKGFKDRK